MVSSIHEDPVSRSDQYKRVMKPLLERKRRARINRCLDELRDLLVSVLQAEGEAVTRLEKADILELTVRHVRRLSQRRRLSLPTPSAKHQQDREDVVKFQEGFVAAAQQVQTFLMSTNSLEPNVSSRLLTHLTTYATSITPPPAPAVSPVSAASAQAQQAPHPPNHTAAPVSARSQVLHQSPTPPQFAIVKTAPGSPPTQYVVPQNKQQQQPHSRPVTSSAMPPPPPPFVVACTKPITQSSPQQPLIDLSNRQPQTNNFTAPIIRDVKCEDRKMPPPSPFIDVVSTENDLPPPAKIAKIDHNHHSANSHSANRHSVNHHSVNHHSVNHHSVNHHSVNHHSVKLESPPAHSNAASSYELSRQITLQLQAKVVASISVSQAQQRCLPSANFNSHMYAVASQNRPLPSPEERQSPIPQDLSMKKYNIPDDGSPSWRPW